MQELSSNPSLLTSISGYALGSGTYQLVKEGNQKGFINQLRMAHLARTWHWRAMVDDSHHHITLPDCEAFECGRVEPNSDVDFGSWLEGIYIAMILRDVGAVKMYGLADPEKVVRYGQNKPDPWEIPYINFLNGIWDFDPKLLDNLKAAMQGTEPSLYNPERADYLLHIISPAMELWAKVFSRDEELFNQGLYEQQKIRHDWHEALGEDDGNSIMEYIDLAALAAVCHATTLGMKVEVKSHYLPEFLINLEFPRLQWPDPEWGEWPKDLASMQ